MKVLVGGETAAGIDASSYLSHRLPLVIALVILVSFLLLMAVFRSVAIPLKAAVMNLLSIGAAYGAIVAVYQWGWLSSLFGGGRPGPIDPWIPLMMFTITFGLSMDYEVFLLSRVQEEWHRTGDNSAAVADGIASTGRVITAAAAIMVCVFGSFVIGDPLRILDVFGLGLAVAILVDATLVRMVLVPSIMQLLGKANWWFPNLARQGRPAPRRRQPAHALGTALTGRQLRVARPGTQVRVRGMTCCTAQRFPSGSLKNTNEPQSRSWTSLTSTPRSTSSWRAVSMSSTTSWTWAEPGSDGVMPVPKTMEQAEPGGPSCTKRSSSLTWWSWSA